MQYDFAIDPITKNKIILFSYFETGKIGITRCPTWDYYNGDFNWAQHADIAKMYSTKEEAESDCKKYLNFLKECGYAI